MRYYLLLPILFFAISYTNGAKGRTGSVSGRVLDDAGKPVAFASVILVRNSDSAMVKTEITDDKGEYQLTPVQPGYYHVQVVMIGYTASRSGTLSVANAAVSLPDITLVRENAGLKEVTVSAQKPFIEVHPDKLVVNVEHSIVSAGTSVMDVLTHSPGVTVDDNDNISLKGKQGVNVMIDGRVVPVSAADLANMLKSMPSSSVDKIEIISNPSAKYDAAGTAGIINIRTKKDNRMGFNGSVTGTYGQGVYPKKGAGFNLNYRQKKLNVYANYNASYRTGFSKVNWDRKYYANDTFNGEYVQQNYTVLQFHTNIAGAGIDYDLTSKTSIGASVTGENYYLGTTGNYFARVYNSGDLLQSYFSTHNTSGGNWNNYAPNVHIRHAFDSAGRELTADIDYARYWNRNTQDFTTRYLGLDGTDYQPPFILHGDIAGNTGIRTVKADYTNPLRNNARFEAGIKSSFVTADNEPKFYDRSSGGSVYNPGISDHYVYNEHINAAYINASKDWTKVSAQFGLRGEQTIINGVEKTTNQAYSGNYIQLFPSLAVQDHLDKKMISALR